MMYYEFNVNDNVYKLRLSTRNVVALEEELGCNPLMVFGLGENVSIPPVKVMVKILHASLKQYNHGISLNDAYDIFDEWLQDGGSVDTFPYVIMDIYKVSGIIKDKAKDETEKN